VTLLVDYRKVENKEQKEGCKREGTKERGCVIKEVTKKDGKNVRKE
jgi:hypothetical protein